ncbi:hypothetical protein OIN60_15520 [Paenibacillus sp. P96]|uniref:Uncharacterized protein n=1 Tax=Paenibacillus zeirhizosphaerae TaxID=2987519 RepID=A0ABT9FTW0_9BACL|nr:hypothetical protein [Paenibacillus sp. P96]MDP4098167.1 hypothetical protein [Paenibacillus sp. P96]
MSMKDMLAIRQAVDYLGEEDIRSYLRMILAEIKILKEQGESPEAFAAGLIELYDSLIGLQGKKVS